MLPAQPAEPDRTGPDRAVFLRVPGWGVASHPGPSVHDHGGEGGGGPVRAGPYLHGHHLWGEHVLRSTYIN